VRDNWILIGVQEQPYVMNKCSCCCLVGQGNCWESGGCAQACGRAERADASARNVVTDKISLSSLKLKCFPLTFIRGGKSCGG
jgi:CO dehydrogenase/acetyl-CoA synthase alpha subunit